MIICQLFWPLKSLPFPLTYHVIFGFWKRLIIFFSFFLSFTCLALQKPSLPLIFFSSSFSFLVLLGFPCIFFFFHDRPSPAVVRLFPAPYSFSFFCLDARSSNSDRGRSEQWQRQLELIGRPPFPVSFWVFRWQSLAGSFNVLVNASNSLIFLINSWISIKCSWDILFNLA